MVSTVEVTDAVLDDIEELGRAILSQNIQVVCGYLDSGLDVSVRNRQGTTPLIQTVYVEKEDVRTHIVRLFVRHGCDVNTQDQLGRTALMHACLEFDRDDVIRRIIQSSRCDPNVRDMDGNTALHHAVACNNYQAIRIIVNDACMKKCLDINVTNFQSKTPLVKAVDMRYAVCCRILVYEGNADVYRVKDRALMKTLLQMDPFSQPTGNADTDDILANASMKLEAIGDRKQRREEAAIRNKVSDNKENTTGSSQNSDETKNEVMDRDTPFPIFRPIVANRKSKISSGKLRDLTMSLPRPLGSNKRPPYQSQMGNKSRDAVRKMAISHVSNGESFPSDSAGAEMTSSQTSQSPAEKTPAVLPPINRTSKQKEGQSAATTKSSSSSSGSTKDSGSVKSSGSAKDASGESSNTSEIWQTTMGGGSPGGGGGEKSRGLKTNERGDRNKKKGLKELDKEAEFFQEGKV